MEVELGAHYRMRNGTCIGPMIRTPGWPVGSFPIAANVVEENGHHWKMRFRVNGRYVGDLVDSPFDLVEKVDPI